MMRALWLVLAFSIATFAQQSVTVTVLQPGAAADQSLFTITVNAGLDSSLDDIVALLNGSGATASNLTSVNSYQSGPNQNVVWTFYLAVPFSSVQNTIAALNATQQRLAQAKSNTAITFNTLGTQASASACLIPDLIADARAQAQKIVSGTGASLGPIVALSDSSQIANVLTGSITTTLPVFRTGFAAAVFGPPSCAIVVQFAASPGQ